MPEPLPQSVAPSFFVVSSILKEGPFGRTEVVVSPSGETFVRKYINKSVAGAVEWEALAQLNDPAFPHIFSRSETPDAYILLMEYVSGMTLQHMVEMWGPMPEAGALPTFEKICVAIGKLHAHSPRPIIHRDIKPSNIIVEGDRVRIVDFGTARYRKDEESRDTRYVGTIGYAAPEQFGFGQTDERTDIYALGMVLLSCSRGLILLAKEEVPWMGAATYLHPQKLSLKNVCSLIRRIVIKVCKLLCGACAVVALLGDGEYRRLFGRCFLHLLYSMPLSTPFFKQKTFLLEAMSSLFLSIGAWRSFCSCFPILYSSIREICCGELY